MLNIERIYDLFPDQSRAAIDALIEDPSFQRQLPGLILQRLNASHGQIVPIDSEILPLFFTKAKFANEKEAYKISVLFGRYFSNPSRFLPLAIDHLQELAELKEQNHLTEDKYRTRGENFASRCLFSLSLFMVHLKNYIQKEHPTQDFIGKWEKEPLKELENQKFLTILRIGKILSKKSVCII